MRSDADLYAQILAATELTRRGRLAEATAVIQCALLTPSPGSDRAAARTGASPRAADVVIDVECVEVADPIGHLVTELALMPPEPAMRDDDQALAGAPDSARRTGRTQSTASPNAAESSDAR